MPRTPALVAEVETLRRICNRRDDVKQCSEVCATSATETRILVAEVETLRSSIFHRTISQTAPRFGKSSYIKRQLPNTAGQPPLPCLLGHQSFTLQIQNRLRSADLQNPLPFQAFVR